MIQGTEILLHTENGTEIVSNVLIGEPSTADGVLNYTLGIPKGDEHTWEDRLIEFFGQKFRTVGHPMKGIEANIPLAWGQNVKAEHLNITGNCTLYRKGTYEKKVLNNAHFTDLRGTSVTNHGENSEGEVRVHVYAVCNTENIKPEIGDILVLGECPFSFDETDEKVVSEIMKTFRSTYDFCVIKSVNSILCGNRDDYEITAR